jgi:putative transposase
MSRAQRRTLVERENPGLAVSQQCRLLAVSRAAVYRNPAEASEQDRAIMALIDRQYLARPYYGSRRMAVWLATQGHVVNRKRVQRLMRRMGLVAIYQRQTRARQPQRTRSIRTCLAAGDRADQSGLVLACHLHPDGQGLSLPGGHHGLGEPCGAGVAAVEHTRRGVLCRGARGSTRP